MGRITDKFLRSLRPPRAGHVIKPDGEVPGFGARITANGVITFTLDYRTVQGRKRRYSLGRWPEWSVAAAREEAIKLRGEISKGGDPLEKRRSVREAPTVVDLAREYMEETRKEKAAHSIYDDESMINNIITPKLGHLAVQSVGERDIRLLKESLKATPIRANRILALLSHMFNRGITWGLCITNPVKGIPRFPETKRERWLSTDELQRFLKAVDQYHNQDAADALRLLVLTGAREGEVLGATWDQFDLNRGIWTKPAHATKQRRLEHVPLNPSALAMLKRRRAKQLAAARKNIGTSNEAKQAKTATPFLFPGIKVEDHRHTLRNPWRQVCKAAGLVQEIAEKRQTKTGKTRTVTRFKPTLRVHDLRHSFASHLVSNGVPLKVVGGLLGHTRAETTQRYAHLADEALRQGANRFDTIFRKAIGRGLRRVK